MEKIILFKSNDGQTFFSEEECLRHEKDPYFKMYDGNGCETTDVHDATLVNIRDPENGNRAFADLSEKEDCSHYGINEHTWPSTGWWWWNGDEYVLVEMEQVQAVARARYGVELK